MKTVYNTSPHKTISLENEGEVIVIAPASMKNVSDEVAAVIKEEWKEAQVTAVSKEAIEPWELKVIPSLPPEMQGKIKFKKPTKLVPAATPEVLEPPVEMENGKPSNNHVCPRGCGFSSPYLKVTRKHMEKCSPIAANE